MIIAATPFTGLRAQKLRLKNFGFITDKREL
jgi:hypothetical protein